LTTKAKRARPKVSRASHARRTSTRAEPAVGVIGGSGLYEMEDLKDVREVKLRTPFGAPSDAFVTGTLDGVPMVFLPRHGRGHRILPSELNFRANIWGMKMLGVEWLIGVSAVGSMKEEIRPGHIVLPDQFIDRTKNRSDTFFGGGVAVHVALADPVCPALHGVLIGAAQEAGAHVHGHGVYLCIEGPQFSTRAESLLYRSWGVDVIGMTNAQEARLAREAEICYATVALATDYDCWQREEEGVTADAILSVLHRNVEMARRLVRHAAPHRPVPRCCPCPSALATAIITDRKRIPAATHRRLGLLLDKYL
jgi:5'-methylthioadenosine phosphorylase